MGELLHDKLLCMVERIYAIEAADVEKTMYNHLYWEGRQDIFVRPIALHKLVLDEQELSKDKLRVVRAELLLDDGDESMRIGDDVRGCLPDTDPIGKYFLEQFSETFDTHDHDLCLRALHDRLEALRTSQERTVLYTAYNERLDQKTVGDY